MIFNKLFNKINIFRPEIEEKKNNSVGKIIEFIGPSGSGKSTLYNETKNSLSSVWANLNNLNKIENNNSDQQLAEIHWKLFAHKFSKVNSINADGIIKLKLMEYFKKVLIYNYRLIQLEKEVGYFLEEGICHNFSSELLYLTNDELHKVIGNRHIVCLLPKDPKLVVHQIRKRTSEGGHTVFHHYGLSDEELEEVTQNAVKNYKKFFKYIEKSNIPVCQLYIEDGIASNTKKIIEFEASLFNKKK